jgi:hypothetical protein
MLAANDAFVKKKKIEKFISTFLLFYKYKNCSPTETN